jgi:two-component system chemotaxis response regulator CheY
VKILVVDDDPVHRKIIEKTLQKGNHEALLFKDAEVAKEWFRKEVVRFVITDWMMPGMDGPSFVRWIRSAKLDQYVYVMLLTSREGPSDIEEGLNAGADDYIKKPFNPPELLARVAVGERILRLEENLLAASNRLKKQALVDELTGLMNRRALYQAGRKEISRARRHKVPLSVLFLDLDRFKQINDTYGHLVGDEALRLTARLLRSSVREYDSTCRWAGDEFIALLPGLNSEQANDTLNRILEAFSRRPLTLPEGTKLTLRASIGVYTWLPDEGPALEFDALVTQADHEMYRFKEARRADAAPQDRQR